MWPYLSQASSPGKFAETVDAIARTPLSVILLLMAVLTIFRLALFPTVKSRPDRFSIKLARTFNDIFDALVYAGIIVFLVIRPFLVQVFTIPSGSMIPTLLIGDFIAANKAVYRYSDPKAGDIVVFRPPKYATTEPDQLDANGEVRVDFIKRCIGTPGETIEIRNGVLFRNGKAEEESFVKNKADAGVDFKLVKYQNRYWPVLYGQYVNGDSNTAEPFRVKDFTTMEKLRNSPAASIPPGYYLMLGDNRASSYDGRSWGLISRDQIIGRAEFIWLPFDRIRRTR